MIPSSQLCLGLCQANKNRTCSKGLSSPHHLNLCDPHAPPNPQGLAHSRFIRSSFLRLSFLVCGICISYPFVSKHVCEDVSACGGSKLKSGVYLPSELGSVNRADAQIDCTTTLGFVLVCYESELVSSRLHSKCFINGAIPSVFLL